MQADECRAFNRRVLDLLEADRNVEVVILIGSWPGYLAVNWGDGWLSTTADVSQVQPDADASRQLLIRSLDSSIETLEASHKKVILFQDVPLFDFDPLWKVRTARIKTRHIAVKLIAGEDVTDPGFAAPIDDQKVQLAAKGIDQLVAEHPGITLVNIDPVLCADLKGCMYRDKDSLLYNDGSHLSPEGAAYALRTFHFPPISQ
jgi:hypothetical protein